MSGFPMCQGNGWAFPASAVAALPRQSSIAGVRAGSVSEQSVASI